MDPLTAVGLVANVVQLIAFTTDVLQETTRLVRSTTGNAPSYDEIVALAKRQEQSCAAVLDITPIVDEGKVQDLDSEKMKYDQIKTNLQVAAKGCAREARALTAILQSLAVKPRDNGKASYTSALWSVARMKLKKDEIEKTERRLRTYQQEIDTALLMLMRVEHQTDSAKTWAMLCSIHDNNVVIRRDNQAIVEAHEGFNLARDAQQLERAVFLSEIDNKLTPESTGVDDGVLDSAQPSSGPHLQRYRDNINAHLPEILRPNTVTGSPDSLSPELKAKFGRLGRERKALQLLVESLDFAELTQRRIAIQTAHHETFQWTLEKKATPLESWLSSPRGIFWINGKAGSGKSTLMKHVTSKPETRGLLRQWAGKSNKLTVVDIYFWYLGSHLQRSEEGLLRSMLFQILDRARDLIPVAMPDRWSKARRAILGHGDWELDVLMSSAKAAWTTEELLESMLRIARCTSDHKFAFFIDGLDEYYADHPRLVRLIQNFAQNHVFKFCVSSRPWNVFVNAFGDQSDMFVLENFTREDIRRYVRSELKEHYKDTSGMDMLAQEVDSKAQGVFLWVFLTVRSLHEGVSEGDSLNILRARVAQLPPDLGEYFDLILSRVNSVYRKLTGVALRLVANAARHDLKLELEGREDPMSEHRRSFLNLWLLQNGLENNEFAHHQALLEVDSDTCLTMVKTTRKFISACCKDLLCIPEPPVTKDFDQSTYLTQYKVQFLHRTVFEFLESHEIQARLQIRGYEHLQDPQFETLLALARLRFIPFRSPGRCKFLNEVLDSFLHELPTSAFDKRVYELVDQTAARYLQYCLDQKAAGTVTLTRKSFPHRDPAFAQAQRQDHCSKHGDTVLLMSLLTRRQHSFATMTMKLNPVIGENDFSHPRRPMLGIAMGHDSSVKRFAVETVDLDFLDSYLKSGINVNTRDEIRDSSPWQLLLHDWREAATSVDQDLDAHKAWKVAKVFIQNGASLSEGTTIKTLSSLVPADMQVEMRAVLDAHIQPRKPRTQEKIKPKTTIEDVEAYYRRTGFRP